jgi:hypothetical protein
MTGIERIAAERNRQIEEERFTAEHDDRYNRYGELVDAAICYAMTEEQRQRRPNPIASEFEILWPWSSGEWKPAPEDRIRELEKAGALVAAEIDRLLLLEGE